MKKMDTKGKVLKTLIETDGYVSGVLISGALSISRAAVNQAVKSLREEGYIIESVTNRGYRLVSMPDILNENSVGAYLSEDRMALISVYGTIDSTNRELMSRAAGDAPDRTVVIADRQTVGRGRRGRSFDSPAGMGIYMSYLMKPSDSLKEKIQAEGSSLIWTSITSWTAAAISDAVELSSGSRPGIKWVNDLYMQGRKLCGILTQVNTSAENNEVESIVIGIGMNVRQELSDFSEEIRDTAGSIYTQTGRKVERARLAAEMVLALDAMYSSWPDAMEAYHKKYVDNSLAVGRDVVLINGENREEVLVTGIGDDFSLIVRLKDGTEKHIISGDISLRFL